MNQFREYLKRKESAIRIELNTLEGLYKEGYIGQEYYIQRKREHVKHLQLVEGIAGQYEKTHRVWEEA